MGPPQRIEVRVGYESLDFHGAVAEVLPLDQGANRTALSQRRGVNPAALIAGHSIRLGFGPGELALAFKLAARADTVLVLDPVKAVVSRFSEDGEHLSEVSIFGTPNWRAVFSPDGSIVWPNAEKGRLVVHQLNSSGEHSRRRTRIPWSAPGFTIPIGIDSRGSKLLFRETDGCILRIDDGPGWAEWCLPEALAAELYREAVGTWDRPGIRLTGFGDLVIVSDELLLVLLGTESDTGLDALLICLSSGAFVPISWFGAAWDESSEMPRGRSAWNAVWLWTGSTLGSVDHDVLTRIVEPPR